MVNAIASLASLYSPPRSLLQNVSAPTDGHAELHLLISMRNLRLVILATINRVGEVEVGDVDDGARHVVANVEV